MLPIFYHSVSIILSLTCCQVHIQYIFLSDMEVRSSLIFGRVCIYTVILYVNVHIVAGVNDAISDTNVVTKIMNNSTGLQRIEFNGFAKHHWKTGYYPGAYVWCLCLF